MVKLNFLTFIGPQNRDEDEIVNFIMNFIRRNKSNLVARVGDIAKTAHTPNKIECQFRISYLNSKEFNDSIHITKLIRC